MVPVPDELLMAYADGELTPQETQALETLLGQDSALRDRLTPFIQTRLRLAAAFEHKLHEPIPDRLIAAIARAAVAEAPRPEKAPLADQIREAVRAFTAAVLPNGLSPALAGTAAALLFFGTATGWVVGRATSGSSLIGISGPDLVASGVLAHALESNPSGVISGADGGSASVMPVLSFRTQSDGVCREYRITRQDAGPDSAGLACRAPNGTWHVALHVETPKQSQAGGAYQTATAANVPAVDTVVESTILGDAFGKTEENALLTSGWDLSHAPERPAHTPGN